MKFFIKKWIRTREERAVEQRLRTNVSNEERKKQTWEAMRKSGWKNGWIIYTKARSINPYINQ